MFTCNFCFKQFEGQRDLKYHLKAHKSKIKEKLQQEANKLQAASNNYNSCSDPFSCIGHLETNAALYHIKQAIKLL